jgi:hypothetical protein
MYLTRHYRGNSLLLMFRHQRPVEYRSGQMNKVILYLFSCFMPGQLMEGFYEGVVGISGSGSGLTYRDILMAPPVVGDLKHAIAGFQTFRTDGLLMEVDRFRV